MPRPDIFPDNVKGPQNMLTKLFRFQAFMDNLFGVGWPSLGLPEASAYSENLFVEISQY